MKIFKDKYNLQNETEINNGISFIPTMGGLHKGHISLIKRSKKFNRKILVSIFINPKQFNKKKDYISYPKNIKRDIKELRKHKVDYLYLPTYKDIYGFKPENKIFLSKLSKKLCGKYRKGHFKGVLNVVNRFLEIIKPRYIFMGKKDYQQLYLVKKHIEKRKIDSKLIECKSIREKNGVVCSTRNYNLNKEQFRIASNLYKLLVNIKKKIKKNNNFKILTNSKKRLLELGLKKIEYIEPYNIKNFTKTKKTNVKFNIFIGYYIKNIRLIDNI